MVSAAITVNAGSIPKALRESLKLLNLRCAARIINLFFQETFSKLVYAKAALLMIPEMIGDKIMKRYVDTRRIARFDNIQKVVKKDFDEQL